MYPFLHHTPTGELFTENFSTEELRCRCAVCNKEIPHQMDPEALQKHQELRTALKRPYRPASSFRCSLHDDERNKETPGEHNRTAMDHPCRGGVQRGEIVKEAIALGATGIGVAKNFVHVDYRPGPLTMWKY